MLSKFQNDLGSISSEIQILQDQSHSMSIKLKNRQVCFVGVGEGRGRGRAVVQTDVSDDYTPDDSTFILLMILLQFYSHSTDDSPHILLMVLLPYTPILLLILLP